MRPIDRLLMALLPRAFGSAYRRAVVDSLRDALADRAGQTGRWDRLHHLARVWLDFLRTVVLERATDVSRSFSARRAGARGGAKEPRFEMSTLWQEIRHAVRSLRDHRSFAAITVATLALGIGGATAIFSIVDAVLLRPLPLKDPDRLVMVRGRWPVRGVEKAAISEGNLADFISDTTAFEEFAALLMSSLPISGQGDPEQAVVARVTRNFFEVIGVEPALGRGFVPADGEDAVVVSHELWRRALGGDPDVLGSTLRLGGAPQTIVGVLPRGLVVPVPEQRGVPITATDIWKVLDLDLDPATASRRNYSLRVFARLAPGASLAQAQQQADAVAAESRRLYADAARVDTRFDVATIHSQVVDEARPTLLAFLAAAGLVLLIACANVANLLLARLKAREAEMSLRAALGAGRARLLRQLLVESLVLALAGALLGAALASLAVEGVRLLQPAGLPRLADVGFDATALGFSLALSLPAAILFGLLPALRGSRASLIELRARGSAPRRGALSRWLVAGEVAVSVVLLIGAGLISRTLFSLARVAPGFEPEGRLTFRAVLPAETEEELARRIASLPGVLAVGRSGGLPLDGHPGRGPFVPDTIDWEDEARYPASLRAGVAPGYFEVMGIGLVRGRLFEERDLARLDAADDPPPVIVDRRLAASVWGEADPIGRTLRIPSGPRPAPPREVVGLVENVRNEGLQDVGPGTIYMPVRAASTFVVRGGEPAALVGPVRELLRRIAPETPMTEVRTLRAHLDRALTPVRFVTALAWVFGAVALALAAGGLYGVVSYAVRQRMPEMGIRIALGARREDVVRLVVGEGLAMVVAGVVAGCAASLALGRLVSSWLYGVTPADLPTYAVTAGLLVAVATLASWAPARRAARADPASVLHEP